MPRSQKFEEEMMLREVKCPLSKHPEGLFPTTSSRSLPAKDTSPCYLLMPLLWFICLGQGTLLQTAGWFPIRQVRVHTRTGTQTGKLPMPRGQLLFHPTQECKTGRPVSGETSRMWGLVIVGVIFHSHGQKEFFLALSPLQHLKIQMGIGL